MTTPNPADDGTHEVGPEPNWNESMYVQFHDASAELGGFLRLATRPNEGRGERTVCLYLPDGSVAFGYDRTSVEAGGAFEGAGLRIEVLEPFEHVRVSFVGAVNLLPDPTALADPKAALSDTAVTGCAVALDLRAVTPPYAETFDGAGESFAPNHHEQLMTAGGVLTLGDTSSDINGFGLRDHSWGPRSWQAPHFYRWLHGSARGIGFMGVYFGDPDGADRSGGFVWDGSRLLRCEEVEVSTDRDGDSQLESVTVVLRAEERRWVFRGRAKSVVPLRHRRGDGASAADATRIAEAAMVWTAEDGTTLHGMAEYLDQIYDGELAGLRI